MMKYNHLHLILSGGFLLAAMGAVCGCGNSRRTASRTATAWDTPRMIAYLQDQPGVRKIEPWNAETPGLCITTDHYQIYTTLNDPLMLRQTPAFVESAYRAYESQLPNRIVAAEPFKTYLFAERNQWETFTRQLTGPDAEVYLKIQRGAYARDGVCIAYNIGRKQTFAILGHEGWHQFNQRYFRYRLPSWIDEGIATLFETCRYHQGIFEFRPQDNLLRLGTLKQTIQQKRLIPLAELITLNPGQVLSGYGSDQDAAMAFYAQNYALVRFLREYNYGIRLNNYHNLLLGGLNGKWPVEPALAEMAANRTIPLTVAWNQRISPALFAMYISEDMEEIETQYRAFCNEIVYRIQILHENKPAQ
jgi:hypothetical protein